MKRIWVFLTESRAVGTGGLAPSAGYANQTLGLHGKVLAGLLTPIEFLVAAGLSTTSYILF